MSMEESISLEETNKIRISLGLKPLTDDSAPANDPEQQAQDNYRKVREREAKERETKQLQDRIAKVRNRRELNASLKGATLGDADADVDDTLKWLKRSKKKEKELAKKRQQELESMDKMFQEDYTEKDLEGLKVGHDFEGLEEGEARILTLKDSRILDNEEDILQNVEMAEEERREKNAELKKKKRDYTGYDDDEFLPGNEGMKRSVLAKYDEDLEGGQETGFRLGASVQSKTKASRQEKEQVAATVNKSLLSIDYAKNLELSDYLQEGDIGFKKPKTKKKRPSRRVPDSSDIVPEENGMAVDEKPIVPRSRDLDANFVDDDELQAALARSRRAKLNKTKKLSPEEIARRIAEEREREASAVPEIKMEEDGVAEDAEGLTIDETSEFVRSITFDPTAVKAEPTEVRLSVPAPIKREQSAPADVAMKDEELSEFEAGEVRVKEEEDEEDESAMLNAIEATMKDIEAEEQKGNADADIGTAGERHFGPGLASTLDILRQQGLLAGASADQSEREKIQRQRDIWLADQRQRVAQRELDRVRARGQNKDQATREYENRLREQQEARETLEAYKDYKPDVQIVYHDEFGRTLTPKEAWKALSHKFHGKGSGRMKTEKRLKRIAEEKKQEAMASGDTPLSMQQAFQMRQEKAGQAHFVLSVGNRGAVPQAEDFLDTQILTKGTGKTEKSKGKRKAGQANAQQVLGADSFITLPQPMPVGAVSGEASASASPAPRAGFSRISAATVDSPSNVGVSGERTKVAISFGAKRKAGDEPNGTPPPKRR